MLLTRAVPQGSSEVEIERALACMKAHYCENYHNKTVPYPGIPELLEQLRAHGFRVAVATGKPTPMACSILQRFDLERLFDCVIGCEYDGTRSTKAEVVAAALAETHTPPEAALMVGDRKYDVTGAAACGVPCLGVYYGYAEPGELEAAGAVTTVQTVAELSERLLHWNEA